MTDRLQPSYERSSDAFFDALRNADAILAEMQAAGSDADGLMFEIHEDGCPVMDSRCRCMVRRIPYEPTSG